MRSIILIAHNLRSYHNVGSLLRTAEGLGTRQVYLTGYTPYPRVKHDTRLPHLIDRAQRQIHKTALGAEEMLSVIHTIHLTELITRLKKKGYYICALEQSAYAVPLDTYKPPSLIALIIGREIGGIESDILNKVDRILEIPMRGQKESFNVTEAASMALYYLTHIA
jgi:23S rRNA (guanosine2251-2'-O)-methyltransferase